MVAIEISAFGGPDVLKPVDRPKPEPAENEVVIRVAAAGVARADLYQRAGKYPPPSGASDIPGLDVAGTVSSNGPGVDTWKVGDRVCAILSGGGYAEYCAAPSSQVLPIPENWTTTEAATVPENLFTAYDNLITRAQLQPNRRALIHGGSSGVGSMAIMLCRLWGAIPFATAGTKEKCDTCLRFGAEQVINYKESDFVEEIHRFTDGVGVDAILDMIGASYLQRNIDAPSPKGHLAIIATQGGSRGEFDIATLMSKRLTIGGATLRARSSQQKGAIAEALVHKVWPHLPSKQHIQPVIDSTFPLVDARLAHRRLEAGAHIGNYRISRVYGVDWQIGGRSPSVLLYRS